MLFYSFWWRLESDKVRAETGVKPRVNEHFDVEHVENQPFLVGNSW